MKKIILLLAIAGFTFSSAQAQTDTATKNFIIKASIGGLQEIAAGKLAAQKGTSTEVKSFGSQMVADHGKAQAKLMQLANAKGYQIPPVATTEPMPDAMLKNAPAKDFDRIYIHMMVPDHRTTVLMFQMYAVSGKDPDIKAFVQQTLPILKEHLEAIKVLDDKIKFEAAK